MADAPSDEEHTDLSVAQQQVINQILEDCQGRPENQIRHLLRRALEDKGLPAPPDPWLRAVAGEIAQDHVYVVSSGSLASDYFSSPAAHRASDRQEMEDHDLEPGPQIHHEVEDEGDAPGTQIV